MKQIELLYFEDLSPFQEAVFAFPILGKISMRQMSIIGFSAMISWIGYQTSENLLSIIPLIIGAYLGLKKFNVKPPEAQFISVIKFMLFKKMQKSIQKRYRLQKGSSQRLGISELFDPKLPRVGRKTRVREIFVDPLKPIRLQIKLETPSKEPISNTRTRVEFDGNVISTLSTNNNGEIEVLIIPQTAGSKKLSVFAEGHKIPVFEEIIVVKKFLT